MKGAASTSSAYCATYPNAETAEVRFIEKTKGYTARASIPCSSGTYAFSTTLPPGTYEVRVDRGNNATQAGTNLMDLSYLAREALPITGPTTGLQLDELSREVRGTITVNGAPVTKGAYCSTYPNASVAEVRFTELQQGFGTTVNVPCAAQNLAFTASLPPGVYEVRVERGANATQAEANLLPGSLMVVQRLEVK